jgi:uncharacterized protein
MLKPSLRAPHRAPSRGQRAAGWTLLIAALRVLCSTGLVVCAQGGYPLPQDKYVTDDAASLTAKEVNDVRYLLRAFEEETSIEMTALVIRSISEYDTGDESIESFATHLFNTWGIGDAARNDGVLILVATEDREVRIELGSGYGSAYNDDMAAVINEHMLPHFRRGDYGAGIYERASTQVRTNPQMSSSSQPASTRPRTGVWALGIGGGLAALGAAGFSLPRVLRYRKRRCPHCQARMVRLDEASDDVYLDAGQRLEEVLKSVDYDIWKCPACNTHTLVRYPIPLSGWKRCPRCNYLTLRTSRHTIVAATYTSTGIEQITQTCRHCTYDKVHTVTLPMLQESSSYDDDDDWGSSSSSSSESSGSSGGGESSGGGASGKW